MQGSELIRLLVDQANSTVKVKLATGRTYNVSGAEFGVTHTSIEGEEENVIWIRTEPAD